MEKSNMGQVTLPEEKLFLEKLDETKFVVEATWKRWVVLSFFMYYACINSFQWIEYCSITLIVVKYYNVSTLSVDWTSIIYMALYPILVVPASYVIDKKGLRMAGLIGCIGTCIGTGIKVFSIRSDLFFIVMIGQAITSASQLVIVCLPPKLASVWFKPNELSTVCSLGIFGTQFGNALGYILPPLMVKDSTNLDEIGSGLNLLCWTLTISMIPVTLAVIFYFPKEPTLPPSIAQAKIRESKVDFNTKMFFMAIKQLFTNKAFVVHMMAYGIHIAVFSAVSTLLTQFILQFFEGAAEDAGKMGFVMVVAGMVGSVLVGFFLDKTHKYKETAVFVFFFAAASFAALLLALEMRSLVWSYVSCALIGLFVTAYMIVGFELGIELTFPLEESTTAGILLSMSQIMGVPCTVLLGYLNLALGCYWSLISQILVMALGTVITAFVPNKLHRQEALKN